jgi:hypothetical protein
MGIIAEKPEKFGQVLFFFVIPETLWIIGFVLGNSTVRNPLSGDLLDDKPIHFHARD